MIDIFTLLLIVLIVAWALDYGKAIVEHEQEHDIILWEEYDD